MLIPAAEAAGPARLNRIMDPDGAIDRCHLVDTQVQPHLTEARRQEVAAVVADALYMHVVVEMVHTT